MDTITLVLPDNYAQLLEKITTTMNVTIIKDGENKHTHPSTAVASAALMIGLDEMAKTWSVK